MAKGFSRCYNDYITKEKPSKDPDPPSDMMRDIVQHSAEEKKEIILGIDANAHHTLWENTDINPRGESQSKGCH